MAKLVVFTVALTRRRADHVPDGLDSAAALGLAEVRHALLEVEDQVFGVHAAPIIAVYGVNDMAPWGHMYVNPGLTEPFILETRFSMRTQTVSLMWHLVGLCRMTLLTKMAILGTTHLPMVSLSLVGNMSTVRGIGWTLPHSR